MVLLILADLPACIFLILHYISPSRTKVNLFTPPGQLCILNTLNIIDHYPQPIPFPYPTSYSGPSNYQINNPTLGFAPNFQHHISMDPNLPTMKQMRLDFPIFGGGDPMEWLNKAEQYFILYQIPNCKKVSIASMHLIDEAADVWHLFQDEYPGTWLGFCELLMKEFGGNTRLDYQAALAKMYQSGSVGDHNTQFNKLSRRASGFSREVLLACFVSGLKEEIRLDVRAHKPTNLLQAYELARIYEERHMGYENIHRHQPTKIASPMGFTARMESPDTSSSLPSYSTPRTGPHSSFCSSSNNRKQLSQAEYHDRRAKNLCFFLMKNISLGIIVRRVTHLLLKRFRQNTVWIWELVLQK